MNSNIESGIYIDRDNIDVAKSMAHAIRPLVPFMSGFRIACPEDQVEELMPHIEELKNILGAQYFLKEMEE